VEEGAYWRPLQRRGHDSARHERHGWRPAALPLHATMLCFLTTDAAIEATALQAALQEAVAKSFNRITVDGDMSTTTRCWCWRMDGPAIHDSRFTVHASRFSNPH